MKGNCKRTPSITQFCARKVSILDKAIVSLLAVSLNCRVRKIESLEMKDNSNDLSDIDFGYLSSLSIKSKKI